MGRLGGQTGTSTVRDTHGPLSASERRGFAMWQPRPGGWIHRAIGGASDRRGGLLQKSGRGAGPPD
jgi:hypothetical protein